MKFKELLTSAFMCGFTFAAMAQSNAEIAVSYSTSEPNFRTGEVDIHHKYVLLANATESKFYSPLTEYIDSLRSTPDGEAKYKEMSRNAVIGGKFEDRPRRDGNYYVVKNDIDRNMVTYDVNGLDKFVMYEVMPEWNWQIADETKNIIGYECQKATTEYHGREWTVWFTPEIPLMNGPWKLGGLPGVILEACDSSGQFSFIADGIMQANRPMVPIYFSGEYEKIDRKDFLKAKRKFKDNPISQINAQLSSLGISIGSTDAEIYYKPREEVDFIETDY